MADPATPRSWRERLHTRWQVKWIVTAAGAVAMMIIVGVFAWNVVTAANPLTQLVPGLMKTAEQRPGGR
jgi:hypothetical protein